MIWFFGKLLMFRVILSVKEFVDIVLIVCMVLLLRCIIVFLLNCFLIWFSVVLSVLFLLLFIL